MFQDAGQVVVVTDPLIGLALSAPITRLPWVICPLNRAVHVRVNLDHVLHPLSPLMNVSVISADRVLPTVESPKEAPMTAPEAHNPELAVTRDEHSTCRLIVETMHEGAMTVSGDGVVVNANPGLQRMVGKSAEQLEGLDPTSLFTEPDATAVSHLISGNGYGHSTIEATLLGADHETPVLVSANTVRDGGHPTTVVILADLSEQHAAARELDESRRKYRMLLENSTAFVLETGEGGVVSWVSPSVTSVLGWLPEQLVGRSLFEFFHPDEVAGARSLMQRVDAGQEAAGRTRLRTASGSYRWLRRTIRPVRDETGVVTSRVSGWQDVQGEVEVWRRSSRQSFGYVS